MPVAVEAAAFEVAGWLAEAGIAVSTSTVITGTLVLAAGGAAIASSALQKSLKPDIPGELGSTGLSALNAQEIKASTKQSVPPQRIVRGRQRSGGAFAFYGISKVAAGKLIIQHMYSRRKITAVNSLNINGNRLSFPGFTFGAIQSPFPIAGQPDYPGKLRVCFQPGTLDQPINPLLAANFPDLPANWRLPGIANAIYEFAYGADFNEHTGLYGNVQIPDVEPEFDGCPVYDSRDPSQFLPGDPNDVEEWFAAQESWKFTMNAVLHQADHLWQPDGLNAGPDGVDWDKIARAADRADEGVATRDTAATGTYEKRYQIGAVVDLSQAPADVFDGMLTASRGVLVQGYDGRVFVESDAPKAPVLTVKDDMMIGAVTFRGFKGRRDLVNKVTTRWVAPDRAYQLSDGPPLLRADLVTEDGDLLAINVDLPYTPSVSAVQRIAKADLEDARVELDAAGQAVHGGATWSGSLSLAALGLRENDCVEIQSKICPHWNGLYLVDSWQLVLSLTGPSGLSVSLIGYDPAIPDHWDAANDDRPFTLEQVA